MGARAQIVLRVPTGLKAAIKKAAKANDGQSINNYVETKLAKATGFKLA